MKGEKERVRRRKEGQQRKAMVALLVFIIATLKIVFGPKKKLLELRKMSSWRECFQTSGYVYIYLEF